jgi:hypothetical protein
MKAGWCSAPASDKPFTLDNKMSTDNCPMLAADTAG